MKGLLSGLIIGYSLLAILFGCAPVMKTITETEAFIGKWYLSGRTPPGLSYTKDTTLSIYEFNSNKSFLSVSRTNGGIFSTNTGTYIVDEAKNLMIMYSSITSTNNYIFIDSQLWQKISNMYVIDYNRW